jgi:hypothetical protein
MRPAFRTGKEIGRKAELLRFSRGRGAGGSSSRKRRPARRGGGTQNRARGLPPIDRLRPSRRAGAAKGKKTFPPQTFQRVFSRSTSDGKQAAAGGPNKVVAGVAAAVGVGAAALARRRRGGAEKTADTVPPATP